MKKLILLMVCVFFTHTIFGQSRNEEHGKRYQEEIKIDGPIKPISRERHIEKRGDYYVIITYTTITEEDYRKLRAITRRNRRGHL